MRIFVSEYVCSGAWPEPELSPSLVREGRAMLLALLTDLARLPDISLCTTWDVRLGQFPPDIHRTDEPRGLSPWPGSTRENHLVIETIHAPADESAAFRRLAAECDATYMIAPEIDDLLTRRCRAVSDAGGRSLNASVTAIAACSDKWETFQQLSAARLPTVPTARFVPDTRAIPFDFPLVIKPRFGAGSQDTFLVRTHDELRTAAARFPSDKPAAEAIIQPYIAGRALSVAAIFRADGALLELWPVGEQHLADDDHFTYRGGRIPSTLAPQLSARISNLISQISNLLPGLRGHIGFDMILPPEPDAVPLIVDINPRLTTSYLGYRVLSTINLAPRILWPDHDCEPLSWHNETIRFRFDGGLTHSSLNRN